MSLWGNNDNVLTAAGGNIVVSGFNGAVTGTGTTFTNFSVGQTLTLGVGATSGFAVIESITSNTAMAVKCGNTGLVPAIEGAVQTYTGATDSWTIGDRPTSSAEDPRFAPVSANAERSFTAKQFGVNGAIQTARKTANSKYAPSHAGWVGVTTYMDMHGNLRVKSETLVAMSGITTQTQATSNILPA